MIVIKKIKEMKIVKKVIVLPAFVFFTICLSGCAGMNGSFDCDVKSGGRCASMGEINQMADRGAFNSDQYKSNHLIQTERAKNQKTGYSLNTFDGTPIRSGESIQQIWIGPYEDQSGNYHEPAYVYTVMKRGSWIGESKSVIQD